MVVMMLAEAADFGLTGFSRCALTPVLSEGRKRPAEAG